jgi:hypothetical protein
MVRCLFRLLLIGLAAGSAWGQTQPGPDLPAPQPSPTVISPIRGLLDIDLPQLDPSGTVKLIFYPHFSDLVRRDYMRVDGGFRWALNDHLELSSEATGFFTHGLRHGSAGYGIGDLLLGAKYVFQEWLRPDFETSVALNVELPVGHPPIDMTDGHNHYVPSFAIQHHLPRNPHLTTFAGAGLDFIGPVTVPGTFSRNEPHADSFSLTAGGVYDVGQLKWTLSGTYATTALLGGTSRNFFYFTPSVLWYVPKKLTFHSKTQWILGLGTPLSWGPDGFQFKTATRVRAEITFRQVMNNLRQSTSRSSPP